VEHREKLFALAVAGLFCLCGLASADDIGGADNTNCPGNDCSGTLLPLQGFKMLASTTATNPTFDLAPTVNLASTIAAESVNGASSVTGALESGAVADWTEMDGGLDARGCNGASGWFVCAQNLPVPLIGPDGTYAWGSDVTVSTASLFAGPLEASVAGLYRDASFEQNGITAQDPTPHSIFKPAWLLLFCSALLGLAAYKVRRRRRA